MFQGTLMQKIRFLGQKLWPVAREQKDRQRYIVKNKTFVDQCPAKNQNFQNLKKSILTHVPRYPYAKN